MPQHFKVLCSKSTIFPSIHFFNINSRKVGGAASASALYPITIALDMRLLCMNSRIQAYLDIRPFLRVRSAPGRLSFHLGRFQREKGAQQEQTGTTTTKRLNAA